MPSKRSPAAATSKTRAPAKPAAAKRSKRAVGTVPSEQDALLAAIYAAPADDAPRAVYADWLLERDDPHGELISLQLAPPERATDATRARERELASEHAKRLLGPLESAVRHAVFARGFATHVQLYRWSAAGLADAPGWATVETIALEDDDRDTAVEAILCGPGRSVRALIGVSPKQLAAIDHARLERVETIDVERGVPAPVIAWLQSARRARRLRLRVDEGERMSVGHLEKLLAAPGRLEHLVLECTDELNELVEAIEQSPIHRFTAHQWHGGAAIRFERGEPGGPFTRACAWREGERDRAHFDGESLDLFLPYDRTFEITVDARELHVPGIDDPWTPTRHVPTDDDLAALGATSVKSGAWSPLDELPLLD